VNSLSKSAPYNLRIVAVQLGCNLLAARVAGSMVERQPDLLRELVALTAGSLLDSAHVTARVASASLAFNVAAVNQILRAKGTESMGEDLQIELLAAVVEALREEKQSKESVRGLVMAVGLLVYMAPLDGEVLDLCRALEVVDVVKGKVTEGLIEGDAAREAVHVVEKGLGG
jgi:desumoylating isopeptidase 1